MSGSHQRSRADIEDDRPVVRMKTEGYRIGAESWPGCAGRHNVRRAASGVQTDKPGIDDAFEIIGVAPLAAHPTPRLSVAVARGSFGSSFRLDPDERSVASSAPEAAIKPQSPGQAQGSAGHGGPKARDLKPGALIGGAIAEVGGGVGAQPVSAVRMAVAVDAVGDRA